MNTKELDDRLAHVLKFLLELQSMNPQPLYEGQVTQLEVAIQDIKDARYELVGGWN